MKYLNTLLIMFLAFGLTGQMTTGSLTLEITDVSTTMPGGEQMAEMMKGSEMSMHFTPEKQVTITNMKMMGMDMKTFNYIEGGKNTTYTDMMGQKIKMTIDIADAKKMIANGADPSDMFQVDYDKSDTKEILGYTCYRADITMDMSSFAKGETMPEGMGGPTKMTAYITDDIEMTNFAIKEFKGLDLQGTPLYMSMDMGVMSMTYEATNFSKGVDPAIFNHPEGDYKEMDPAMLEGLGIKRD